MTLNLTDKSPKTPIIHDQASQDLHPHGIRDQNDLLYLNMCTVLTSNTCNTHTVRPRPIILSRGKQICREIPLPDEVTPEAATQAKALAPLAALLERQAIEQNRLLASVKYAGSHPPQEWLDAMAMGLGKQHLMVTGLKADSGPTTRLHLSNFNIWTAEQAREGCWPMEVSAITTKEEMAAKLNELLKIPSHCSLCIRLPAS